MFYNWLTAKKIILYVLVPHRRGFDASAWTTKSNQFLSNVWDGFTNFHMDLKNGKLWIFAEIFFAPCFENTRNKSFVKNVLILELSWRLSGESLEATIGQKKQISKCWTIIKMIFNHSLIIDPIALEFRFRQPTSAWPWHSFDLGIRLTLSVTRAVTRPSESEVQKRKLLGWAKYFCGNVQD